MKTIFFIALGVLAALPSAAEDYIWGNVRFDGGGFVSAVIPSTTQKNLVYARTDVGGAYRWDPGSGTWIPLMDFISQNDVGLYGTEALALDPTDPAKLYILAGTGYFSGGKTAILRSDDYGTTFDTTVVEFLAHGNGMGRQTGEKLAVDPHSPNILFCGSRSKGLYKSTDHGRTWSNIHEIALSAATGNGLTNVNGISFILFDPSQKTLADGSSSTIYMGVSATSDNLLVSKDGGKTWTQVAGGPQNLMPHRARIADGKLFVTYSSSEGPHSVSRGAVYKYSIAAATWENITPFQDGSTTARMGDGGQSASHGFGGISIDPADPDHIIVSTLCFYGGRHLYANGKDGWGDRIYVTKDGGKNWKHGQGYDAGVNTDANGTAWIPGHAIHWAGSVEFDPFDTKKAWVTSGNGIFQTDDVSQVTPVWKFQSRGIEETVPLDIVSVPDGPLVTAIGDYDGAAYTNIHASTPLHEPHIGTTHSLGHAPLKGYFVRTGNVTDYSTGTGISSNVLYFSEDNAKTWTQLPAPKATHGLLVLSADGEVILHRPDNANTVYRSANRGVSWTEVKGLDGQDQYARIVSDPVEPSIFYVLGQQGKLKKSTDKGVSFSVVGSLQNDSKGEYQNSSGLIRTVPGRKGHIWAPLDQAQSWLAKGYSENGLAFSEDEGTTWTRLSNVFSAISVGLGKAAPDAAYEALYIWGIAGNASNPLGIYRSTDKGITWNRINDDRHQFGGPGNGNFVVGDFNAYGRVYMSTVGRGLVYGAIEGTEPVRTTRFPDRIAGQMHYQAGSLSIQVTPGDYRLMLFNAKGTLLRTQSLYGSTNVSLRTLSQGMLIARLVNMQGQVISVQEIAHR